MRSGDRQAIAARSYRNTELALDPIEMAVALAVELRQQGIVVELHLQALAIVRHALAPAIATSPDRLLRPAPVMRTGKTVPRHCAGAAA